MPIGFEPIIPKEALINSQAFAQDLRVQVDKVTGYAQGLYNRTTTTWDRRPQFERVAARITGDYIEGGLYTDDEKYILVCRGTSPHIITPRRRGGKLSIPAQFRPKTKPRSLTSYPGFRGGNVYKAKSVRHPGAQARDFDLEINARAQERIDQAVRILIDKYARQSRKGG